MAGMEVRIYRQTSVVSYFDVDVRLRMAPVAYWKLLQNAAAAHAAALSAATEELRKTGQTWMLSKMRLDVERHFHVGDAVYAETWPSTRIKGARAYRDFVLKDSSGQVCARAASLWVIVDLESRRPVRIPDAIAALSTDPGYEIAPVMDGWIDAPAAGDVTPFRAYWSDADQNEHVNNVTMLRWAVDAMPLEFLEAHTMIGAEVHYRAEASVGDEVAVTTEVNGLTVRQSIVRGDVVVALVETRWQRSDAATVAPEQDVQAR